MRNKISPEKTVMPAPSSQQSFNTQHNFMSVNELSSVHDLQKNNTTTISGLRKKHLMQFMVNKIRYLIAPYIMPSHVRENWNEEHKADISDDEKGTERHEIISEIKYKYGLWHVIMMIDIICTVILFWMSSIEFIFLPRFQSDNFGNLFPFQAKAVPCCLIIFKIILEELLIVHERALLCAKPQGTDEQAQKQFEEEDEEVKTSHDQLYNNLKYILKNVLYIVVCLIYLLLHILNMGEFKYVVQVFIVVALLNKAWSPRQSMEKIYSYVEAKDLKNQWRILVLFFVVLGACHCIALVLYSLTYMYPTHNWIDSVGKVDVENTWLSHYTCSIYFTITTMATVGYGDFTPVKTGEMFTVSFIQLFGTALFGYMINVVGLSVVEINKKNQEFDNHISTINKLQSHYQISRQLCQKFKDDIIKNQSVKKETPLSQNEETQFFKMVQNSLKEQFILQTNIKVIKKSIFFLIYFTVNFQNEVALKLIRKIYKKSERLPLVDTQGERFMVIINSGSVDIDIANQSSNMELRKFIKNISPQEGKPTLNVFGYSGLILNRDIDLEATTKEISVIYLLRRKDVLECMDKNMLDFEGIAELRERMLHYRNINHIEAPSILDIEKHYIANVYLVNKRKKRESQSRNQTCIRSNRRCRIKVITLKNYQFRTMVCIDLSSSSLEDQNNYLKIKALESNKEEFISEQQPNSMRMIEEGEVCEAGEVMKLEQVKNYQNFMKKSNFSKVSSLYHEYLRRCRKQRATQNQNKKQNNEENVVSELISNRVNTYTEGMSRITERIDE